METNELLQRMSPTVATPQLTRDPMIQMVEEKGGDFISAEGIRIFIIQNRSRDPSEVLGELYRALSL